MLILLSQHDFKKVWSHDGKWTFCAKIVTTFLTLKCNKNENMIIFFSFSDWVDVCYFIHRRSSSNGHFLECCVSNCRFLDTFFDAHSSFQSIFHLHAVHVKKEEEESVRFKITIFKCTKIQFFVVQLQLFCWVELSCYWIQSWSRNFFVRRGFQNFVLIIQFHVWEFIPQLNCSCLDIFLHCMHDLIDMSVMYTYIFMLKKKTKIGKRRGFSPNASLSFRLLL